MHQRGGTQPPGGRGKHSPRGGGESISSFRKRPKLSGGGRARANQITQPHPPPAPQPDEDRDTNCRECERDGHIASRPSGHLCVRPDHIYVRAIILNYRFYFGDATKFAHCFVFAYLFVRLFARWPFAQFICTRAFMSECRVSRSLPSDMALSSIRRFCNYCRCYQSACFLCVEFENGANFCNSQFLITAWLTIFFIFLFVFFYWLIWINFIELF